MRSLETNKWVSSLEDVEIIDVDELLSVSGVESSEHFRDGQRSDTEEVQVGGNEDTGDEDIESKVNMLIQDVEKDMVIDSDKKAIEMGVHADAEADAVQSSQKELLENSEALLKYLSEDAKVDLIGSNQLPQYTDDFKEESEFSGPSTPSESNYGEDEEFSATKYSALIQGVLVCVSALAWFLKSDGGSVPRCESEPNEKLQNDQPDFSFQWGGKGCCDKEKPGFANFKWQREHHRGWKHGGWKGRGNKDHGWGFHEGHGSHHARHSDKHHTWEVPGDRHRWGHKHHHRKHFGRAETDGWGSGHPDWKHRGWGQEGMKTHDHGSRGWNHGGFQSHAHGRNWTEDGREHSSYGRHHGSEPPNVTANIGGWRFQMSFKGAECEGDCKHSASGERFKRRKHGGFERGFSDRHGCFRG